jgi:hypothetical protein
MHSSRSHDAVIRVYDATGNVIETHEGARHPRPEKVTEMSLYRPPKGLEASAMEAKRNGQNSHGLTTGHDVYEVRPRKGRDGVDLISERFRYGPIWYSGPDAVRNAVAYAKYCSLSRARRAIIRVLDDFGAVIQTH